MKCQNCGGETIVIRTAHHTDTTIRIRHCLECRQQRKTIEQWSETIEQQAYQASFFKTMISPEARETARAIMERNGLDATRREENKASLGYRSTTGGPSDSAPGTVTGNGAAADGAPGAGS